MDFAGKVAVVTGSSGIGLAAALHFAQQGAQTYLCGIDDSLNTQAQAAAGDLPLRVASVDVAREDQVARWIEGIAKEAGGIDILVNAAAVQSFGTVETTDAAHWNRVLAINLTSCFLTSHYVYPHMKTRGGGAIVHVSSIQGHANQVNVLAYATSKGAIHAMTRAMAVDAARDNIRVNSVSPGSIRTPLLEFSAIQIDGAENMEETIAGFGRSHPIGRVGTVDETTALIAFLCSDKATFCAGGDYLVDGGLTARAAV